MRQTLRSLSLALGAGGAFFLSAVATAAVNDTISVNFGDPAYSLTAGETAGAVPAVNWNNAISSVGATMLNVTDAAGASSVVDLTYVSGGPLTSNFTPGVATNSDTKMMGHSWASNHEHGSQSWFDLAGPASSGTFWRGLDDGAFGNRDGTAVFSSLNAQFPNGYDVYVYVQSYAVGQPAYLQPTTPLHVVAGTTGAIAAVQTGDTEGDHLQFGTNDFSGPSMEDPANLPATAQRALLWPTAALFGGYTEAVGSIGATDNMPLDLRPLEAIVGSPPSSVGDYPATPTFNALAWHDPTTRGIPVGNYVRFAGLSFDTLEILATNIHGIRSTAGSSGTSEFEVGGIAGIQIVGLEAEVEAVPEPSTFALAGLGLAGLGLVALRRRRG